MAKFAVIYGQTDFSSESGLKTLFVSKFKEVKKLAKEFVTVIPDDLDAYLQDINDWDGVKTPLDHPSRR